MSRQVVLLASHPVGEPKDSDFRIDTQELAELADGQVRVEGQYFSVDPYLRGKMSGRTTYHAGFQVNAPVASFGVGSVIESKHPNYSVGDRVAGEYDWADKFDVDGAKLHKLVPQVSAETALSIVGITGLTAYFGLFEVGRLQEKPEGSTVLISGAAGATGNVVGQIAKIKGYRVVGIAGSDDKTSWLKNDLGFDEVINYKTAGNLFEAIKAACPNGIDLYWDNVGGETYDHALQLLNRFGVVVACGAISSYNAVETELGPRLNWLIITKSLRVQGFIVMDFAAKIPEASGVLLGWLAEGKLKQQIQLYNSEGDIFGIPKAFIKMLSGDNLGKSIVKIK